MTYRYDAVNRQVSESRTPGAYSLSYGYDAVGNRTTRTLDGTTYTNVYDDNNKLTSASGGGLTASFGYDNDGNMTSVSGTMYTAKTLVYNDANRLTSITYSGVTDTYTYNWQGLRTRALLSGTYQRYFYDGERVLEDLNDSGGTLARYTITDGTYSGMLLGFQRSDGSVRYPILDEIGSARRLVDGSATVTDAYSLDAFGRNMFTSGSTPNPYRYGAAWGYITDPSGLLQLGARFYWPELGRFVSQDPVGHGLNWYAYAESDPTTVIDPTGLRGFVCPSVGHAWGERRAICMRHAYEEYEEHIGDIQLGYSACILTAIATSPAAPYLAALCSAAMWQAARVNRRTLQRKIEDCLLKDPCPGMATPHTPSPNWDNWGQEHPFF